MFNFDDSVSGFVPREVRQECHSTNISLLYAHECLYYAYGRRPWIKYIWAIGLLAAGQSSTMTVSRSVKGGGLTLNLIARCHAASWKFKATYVYPFPVLPFPVLRKRAGRELTIVHSFFIMCIIDDGRINVKKLQEPHWGLNRGHSDYSSNALTHLARPR